MKISAIKIFNIRSFLDNDNYLMLEDTKTAIIGVNESGKSNILETIGKLDFLNKLGNHYDKIKNLSVPEESVSILVQLHMKQNEMKKFGITEDREKTLLTFKVGQATTISGTLSNIIAQNEIIKSIIEFWDNLTLSDFYNLTTDNRSGYSNAIQIIKNCSSEIIQFSQLEVLLRNFKKDVNIKQCVDSVNNFKAELSQIYNMFPVIMYKQCDGIVPVKAVYVNTEAVKDLENSNSSLYKLTCAAGIEINDMKKAFELPEGNVRHTLRFNIERAIQKKCVMNLKNFILIVIWIL